MVIRHLHVGIIRQLYLLCMEYPTPQKWIACCRSSPPAHSRCRSFEYAQQAASSLHLFLKGTGNNADRMCCRSAGVGTWEVSTIEQAVRLLDGLDLTKLSVLS